MKQEKKSRLLLGAHMSIAGGIYKALERGASIGCTCIQIFTKSNQQWHAKPLTQSDIENYKTTYKQLNINPVITHASYLINLGSPDSALAKKSAHALEIELQRCQALEIPYLVFHPGAHVKGDKEKSLKQVAHYLDEIMKNNPGKTMILIENTAGQGTTLGSSFEELATIRSNSHYKHQIGFCFDTCHAFTAGYDLRSKDSYEKTWKHFDKVLGLEHLKAIHINDSKQPLGSKKDRHEHIGRGEIGDMGFSLLFNDERFFDIPKILETPKGEDLIDDKKNIEHIKHLLTSTTQKKLHL